MKLLAHEKALLYSTYLQIASAKISLIDAFYQRLFEIDPILHSLFKASIHDQNVRWRLELISAISTIDQDTVVQESLRALGRRHQNYGVKVEDFSKLVEAFLWALHTYLGSAFTSNMDIAWRKFFDILIELITQTYYEPPTTPR